MHYAKDDVMVVKCFICDGQGFFVTNQEAYGGWLECPECHGKGWLTEQEVEENRATWLKDVPKPI